MVSSGASESRATVILYEGMEKVVQNESLVVIRNKNGGDVLAVCRGGRGVNENVRTSGFTPGVAYAKPAEPLAASRNTISTPSRS